MRQIELPSHATALLQDYRLEHGLPMYSLDVVWSGDYAEACHIAYRHKALCPLQYQFDG